MNMRKGWSGAMRRVAEVSGMVAGTGKQIPRRLKPTRDDKQDALAARLKACPFKRDQLAARSC